MFPDIYIYMFVQTSEFRHDSPRGAETSSWQISIGSRLAVRTFLSVVNDISDLEAIREYVGFLSQFCLVSIHLRV